MNTLSYSTPGLTPVERVRAAFDEFPCDDDTLLGTLVEQLGTWEGVPLLLIEQGAYGTWYMTLHHDRDEAADYNAGQECAEDWDWYALVDLMTGEES